MLIISELDFKLDEDGKNRLKQLLCKKKDTKNKQVNFVVYLFLQTKEGYSD